MYTDASMSGTTKTLSPLELIAQKAAQQESRFKQQYEELYKQICAEDLLVDEPHFSKENQSVISQGTAVTPAVVASLSQANLGTQQMFSQITAEEHAEVMEKARSITQLPAGAIDQELGLYLEQQLSEILGFSISTKLENRTLPYTHGSVAALHHYKRTPTDTLSQHEYQYASFTDRRSFFGWLNTGLGAQRDGMQAEKYGVAVPLFSLPDWQTQSVTLTKWYAFRKVVLINPTEMVAVVARIADNYPVLTSKYQFGATPETIVAGKCWSQATAGKVLIFFVDDNEQDIPLGPVSLQFQGRVQ